MCTTQQSLIFNYNFYNSILTVSYWDINIIHLLKEFNMMHWCDVCRDWCRICWWWWWSVVSGNVRKYLTLVGECWHWDTDILKSVVTDHWSWWLSWFMTLTSPHHHHEKYLHRNTVYNFTIRSQKRRVVVYNVDFKIQIKLIENHSIKYNTKY